MLTLSNHFISRFTHWAARMGYPPRIRKKLPSALRKLPIWLARRDHYQDIVLRTLNNDDNLRINVGTSMAWVYSSGNRLVLGAVGPSWPRVRKLSSDFDTDDLIDDFVFLAGQYAVRSRLVAAIGGLTLSYGVVVDFRHADHRIITVGPQNPVKSVDAGRQKQEAELPPSFSRSNRRSRELTAWLEWLNPFDPIVHRALFQYWRARSMWNADFGEEAITALDGVTAVASDGLRAFTGQTKSVSRSEVATTLGLSSQDGLQLERLYKLRCLFGAHPPTSKWWDFSEMYTDDIDSYFDLCRRVIAKVVHLEKAHRRVDSFPSAWSVWFATNANMLFDIVWFGRTP